jgi:integrase
VRRHQGPDRAPRPTADHHPGTVRPDPRRVADPELQLLVETDIETGLRWGELVELRVHDLDLHHGQLTVSRVVIEIAAKFHPDGKRFLIKNYPKDKQPRRLGLSRHIRDLLTEY